MDQFKNKTLPAGVTDKDLWEAQKIVQVRRVVVFFWSKNRENQICIDFYLQAIVHPDTGEKIYRPFRMAGALFSLILSFELRHVSYLQDTFHSVLQSLLVFLCRIQR